MYLEQLTQGQFEASMKRYSYEGCLEALKHFSKNSDLFLKKQEEGYSTMKEVTAHFKVTKPTIYNWKKEGLITSYPHVGRVLFKIKEIEETMEKNRSAFGKRRKYKYREVLLP